MSKFKYLIFIILCSCASKVKNTSSNNLSTPKIEKKEKYEFFEYDKINNSYTLKLNETEPFNFSLNKDSSNKLYEKVTKDNTTITEASQNPLVKLNNNEASIENYLLNGDNDVKSNLETAIDIVLRKIKEQNILNLTGDTKEAFEKSFGNYFFDLETGDLTKLKQDENKIKLLETLSKLLKDNKDVNKFLQTLHIEKIKTNKNTIFLNGKSLNNFNYFDFGIWEQDIFVKYKGNEVLKEYYNLKDINKHKFIPFIYANNENKIAIKPNTAMAFSGSAFAGVKNNDKYKIFYGRADFKIDENNSGKMIFNFNNWAKFTFYNIKFNGENFDETENNTFQ